MPEPSDRPATAPRPPRSVHAIQPVGTPPSLAEHADSRPCPRCHPMSYAMFAAKHKAGSR